MAASLLSRMSSRVSGLVATARSSSLARAALTTGILTILCKLLGFAKELQIASRFGVGSTLDSYLVAVVLPNLVSNVFAISFASSLVIQYVKHRTDEGEEIARERYAATMFWGMLFISSVVVTGVALGPVLLPWMSPGFRPELRESTQSLLWMMVPYTILAGMSAIWSAILSARGRFAAAAMSPGVISIAMILVVWVWQISDARVLVAGLTIGSVVDLLVLGYCLRQEGLPLMPTIGRWHPENQWIVSQTAPMIVASLLRFSSIIIDQSMASTLGEGSVSELNYGSRWVAMVQGLISLPLGRILFPHFVQLVSTRQWLAVRTLLRQSVLVLLAIAIPITVILAAFSGPLVHWTFERGRFTPEMTTRVAAVQVMYALQFPFFLWSALLGRLAVAMQLRRVILTCGVLNLAMNIGMNYLLMQRMGVTGIALSTALVYLSAACYFSAAIGWALKRKIREGQEIESRSQPDSDTPPEPLAAA